MTKPPFIAWIAVVTLAIGGCVPLNQGDTVGPNEGDTVTYRGEVEEGVECLLLHTDEGETIGLLGPKAKRLRPGQSVEVTGRFGEASICYRAAVHVQTVGSP